LDKVEEKVEWLKPVPSICIHYDNQIIISRAQNFIYNNKSKHIHRRHNTVRPLLSNRVISIDFMASKNNLVDPLTKNLSGERINCIPKEMGLKA